MIKSFERFNFLKNLRKNKVTDTKRKFTDRYFTKSDVDEIKDLFLEIAEKYNLEEDENGEILNYINISATSKKGREKPQYFVELNNPVCTFTIASSSSFLTDELISDVNLFKERLEKFNYRCDRNDTLHRPYIKYISFYINKVVEL